MKILNKSRILIRVQRHQVFTLAWKKAIIRIISPLHHQKLTLLLRNINYIERVWTTMQSTVECNFPSKDYYNCRVKDFEDVTNWEDSVDRTRVPRMPWHDIHCMLVGECARDVGRHFIHRWNFTLAAKGSSRRPHTNYCYSLDVAVCSSKSNG